MSVSGNESQTSEPTEFMTPRISGSSIEEPTQHIFKLLIYREIACIPITMGIWESLPFALHVITYQRHPQNSKSLRDNSQWSGVPTFTCFLHELYLEEHTHTVPYPKTCSMV